jgi:hypothetical protein
MDKLSVMRELLAQLSKDAKGRVAGRLKSKYSPPPGAELRSGSEVPQAPEAAPVTATATALVTRSPVSRSSRSSWRFSGSSRWLKATRSIR